MCHANFRGRCRPTAVALGWARGGGALQALPELGWLTRQCFLCRVLLFSRRTSEVCLK